MDKAKRLVYKPDSHAFTNRKDRKGLQMAVVTATTKSTRSNESNRLFRLFNAYHQHIETTSLSDMCIRLCDKLTDTYTDSLPRMEMSGITDYSMFNVGLLRQALQWPAVVNFLDVIGAYSIKIAVKFDLSFQEEAVVPDIHGYLINVDTVQFNLRLLDLGLVKVGNMLFHLMEKLIPENNKRRQGIPAHYDLKAYIQCSLIENYLKSNGMWTIVKLYAHLSRVYMTHARASNCEQRGKIPYKLLL